MSRKITTPTPPVESEMEQGWKRNTELAVNVKTMLRRDRRMVTGKAYQGVLRRDSDEQFDDFLFHDPHYTFVETLPSGVGKRNPHVYEGRYITVTRWDDGSLHPNFRPMGMGSGLTVDGYAIAVCNELRQALTGLVEER